MKILAVLAVLVSCQTTESMEDCCVGVAYTQSYDSHLGLYDRGSDEWDKKNQEWIDSDEDTPYPEYLKEIDGDAYIDSVESALNAEDED